MSDRLCKESGSNIFSILERSDRILARVKSRCYLVVNFLTINACYTYIIPDRLRDRNRYGIFCFSLGEGISTNILANCLKLLISFGLVEKQPYSNHSRRMNYFLTEKGESLRPIMKVMIAWGLKHLPLTMVPESQE